MADTGTIFHLDDMEVVIMKSFLRVMKALSDPSRVKIIKMLQKG